MWLIMHWILAFNLAFLIVLTLKYLSEGNEYPADTLAIASCFVLAADWRGAIDVPVVSETFWVILILNLLHILTPDNLSRSR